MRDCSRSICFLSLFAASTACPADIPATKMGDSIVDPEALTFLAKKSRETTAINGRSYQQDAVVSHGGWQYV